MKWPISSDESTGKFVEKVLHKLKKEEVERIFEHAKYELLALVCAEPVSQAVPDKPLPEWITEEQLAEYWQLDSTSGIQLWQKGPLDRYSLLHISVI